MQDQPVETVPSGPFTTEGEGTLWALIAGFIVSTILSAALVFTAAKAGITPGVSPLVILFGWIAFGAALGKTGKLKRFLAIAQVTGSAGAAVSAGVVFTAPITQILHKNLGLEVPAVNVGILILACAAGAFMGWGLVGLATRKFLTDPRLPAPEAVAADSMIQTAAERPEDRPPILRSLVAGLGIGAVMNLLIHLKLAADAIPLKLNLQGQPFTLGLPMSPLFIGIGVLLPLETAVLIFLGGFVNATTVWYSAVHGMSGETFRWVGGAAMAVAVVYSLGAYIASSLKEAGAAKQDVEYDEKLLVIDHGVRRRLHGAVLLGIALMAVMIGFTAESLSAGLIVGVVAVVLAIPLTGLGGLLSLQVGSSASPVSGTVFSALLVLSLAGLGAALSGVPGVVFLVPIVVATCVSICAGNDSSQDYKTMQLNGFRVSDGFNGQMLGLLGAVVVVPLALFVAHDAYTLGSTELPCPQASFFGQVLQTLFLQGDIPWPPVIVGAVLGVVAVGVEIAGKRLGLTLSSLAFAVGIYLPSAIGTGILIGAGVRSLVSRRRKAEGHNTLLLGAGLITGDALMSLVIGVAIFAGPETVIGVIGGLLMLALIVLNAFAPRSTVEPATDASEDAD